MVDNHLLAKYAVYEKMAANAKVFGLVFLTILGMKLLFCDALSHLIAI